LNLLGPRKHSIRTRRLSARKQTLYRRDDVAPASEWFHDRQQVDLQSTLSPAASSRPRFMKESPVTSPAMSSKHRRCDVAASVDAPIMGSSSTCFSHEYRGPMPLPPAILRVNMPGSPLSPFDAHTYADYVFPRHSRASAFGGARTMGAGGRSGGFGGRGGRGDSPVPAHPSQDDCGDNDEVDESDRGRPAPSSYTFRRRNAIVEGVEDAPRADDFSDSS
ncbi:hypothetical protein BGX31_000638, partial [Mortierella sp. GBA43]